GGFYPSHAFQACDLNRSSTAPAASILTETRLNLRRGVQNRQEKSHPKVAFFLDLELDQFSEAFLPAL
ncbi:MAG: hypothetical protein Q8R49_01845, partial [Rhodoferax sp.]|nr:hypothetical protein [Rhodoferax sp.]